MIDDVDARYRVWTYSVGHRQEPWSVLCGAPDAPGYSGFGTR